MLVLYSIRMTINVLFSSAFARNHHNQFFFVIVVKKENQTSRLFCLCKQSDICIEWNSHNDFISTRNIIAHTRRIWSVLIFCVVWDFLQNIHLLVLFSPSERIESWWNRRSALSTRHLARYHVRRVIIFKYEISFSIRRRWRTGSIDFAIHWYYLIASLLNCFELRFAI